jgi:hypothetical protein
MKGEEGKCPRPVIVVRSDEGGKYHLGKAERIWEKLAS